MLDTNTVSHLLRAHPNITKRVLAQPMASLCISAITKSELLFGLAKRPEAKQLHLAVQEFLRRVEVLPWESAAAECYGTLRAEMERQRRSFAPLDMLIGSHAISLAAILVTNDKAFRQITKLQVEDWTE